MNELLPAYVIFRKCLNVMRNLSNRMCQNFASSVRRVMREVKEGREAQVLPEKVERQGVGNKRPFTVVVEGNIGSGKSTFLQHFERWSSQVELLPEPVESWRNLKGHNLLQQMYEQPERHSLTFQT